MQPASHPSVLITGGAGLIGSHVIQAAPRFVPGWTVHAPPRRELDLTDFAGVEKWFRKRRPALVLHCAALSRAATCEADPALARRLNIELTRLLVGLARDVPFVFLSSDLVFNGEKGNYVEEDAVGPLSVYAQTKAAAEEIVRGHPRHLIVRTSLNYGHSTAGHRAFNEEIIQSWQQGRVLTFFSDEFRSPIPAEVTARAVWELVGRKASGVFHLGGAERLSRWAIAELLLRRHPEFRELAQKGSLKDFQGPPRPADTSLNSAKAQALLSFPLPRFSEWMKDEGSQSQVPRSG